MRILLDDINYLGYLIIEDLDYDIRLRIKDCFIDLPFMSACDLRKLISEFFEGKISMVARFMIEGRKESDHIIFKSSSIGVKLTIGNYSVVLAHEKLQFLDKLLSNFNNKMVGYAAGSIAAVTGAPPAILTL